MIWEIGTIAKHVLLPPLGLGWLLVLAWWQFHRRPRLARGLIACVLLGGLFMAVPLTSELLLRQVRVASDPARHSQAQAIVVLGGGRGLVWDAAYEQVLAAYPNAFTLERLRVGAHLARQTGLPLLVSAGKPDGYDPSEAEVMRRAMQDDFGIAVRWIEDRSRNTAENADFTARILLPQKIRTIILVSSAFHLRRAITVFEQAGFDVIPAQAPPVGPPGPIDWQDFLPNAQSLMRSHYAFNELGGLVYSWLRAKPTPSSTVGN